MLFERRSKTISSSSALLMVGIKTAALYGWPLEVITNNLTIISTTARTIHWRPWLPPHK